ncbi:TonB-dependent receptor [Oceaniferula spumae]|uniref:TonB-dependent receptor n=1 Tax=Oceaniferula spumae TaxID=2979115 RepID=A0AAT9FS71_9BACT
MKYHICAAAVTTALVLTIHADEEEAPSSMLDHTVIQGKATDLLGVATSASYGIANNEELSQRPTLRRGELLEVVPGMVVTQHAGGGKANQYFIRGYNLDHGTDFHIGIDGMPANYRTHAHGQGYADINFIVPELVESLRYFKGPVSISHGDLSTAGGADYQLYHVLPHNMASVTYGSDDYYRLLLAGSQKIGEGHLSIGTEYSHEDGPWEIGNDYDRFNLFARYHCGTQDNYWNITALLHYSDWNSSDQIPARAVSSGQIDRYGAVDPTTGGETQRHTLSFQWHQDSGDSVTHLDVWAGYYSLQLYSNFTYFLNDPVRGDQFEQDESRYFAGMHLWKRWNNETAGLESHTTVGVQTRNDWINDIGLYLTENRNRYQTIRRDDVYVGSYSAYVDHEIHLTPKLKVGVGLRGDLFHFDVDSDLNANSGQETAGIVTPKFRLVYSPVEDHEFYFNIGNGFHSNDARGTTLRIDPTDGVSPLSSVDPLVRTKGADIGWRSTAIENLHTTLNIWYLESDSELVYVGDAGTSEVGDSSRRWGVELAAYWRPTDWVSLDVEYAWSDARFTGVASGMDYIPNSVDHTASIGISLGQQTGWFGSLRGRYLSPRPLEESGEVMSKDSFIVNARVGYRKDNWEASLDVLNVFDRSDRDIEYFYESRLDTELVGTEDVHYHPTEPRQVRLNFIYKF